MLTRQVNQEKVILVLLNKSFKFQPNVCSTCHHLLMSMKLSDIAILNIEGCRYCCINSGINKLNVKYQFDQIIKAEHYKTLKNYHHI